MSNQIMLKFLPLCGGPHEGIHDGDIETFEGNVGHCIARECAQNTIDAVAEENKTAELRFDLEHHPIDYFPSLINLKEVINSCRKFWQDDPKVQKFTTNALKLLEQESIPMLKISDYGTTGLTGDDFTKMGKWYGLVRSKGVCNKKAGEGGSFGIGKSAALAASALRTVYYFTKTPENIAFQGVVRLVTHLDNNNKETRAFGYIGYYDNGKMEYYSVRDSKDIPSYFLRNQVGTDIYIPAYKGGDYWKAEVVVAILNDFWCAIEFGLIKFRIGDLVIDKSNIKDFMRAEFTESEKFFRAYKNGAKFETELAHIGKVKLYLNPEDEGKTKEVVVMRKNLMIIDCWSFYFRKSFSGVFICDNEEGNKILREMEPPQHNKWDPARLEGKIGNKIIKSIKDWIKECANNLMPLPESENFELSDIAKYLPDILDDDNDDHSDKEGDNKPSESFNTVPAQPEVKPIPVFEPRNIVSQEKVEDEEKIVVISSESGDGKGGEGGNKQPITRNIKAGVMARFIYNSSDNSYTVVLRSKQDFKGKITLLSVGEDNETEPIYVRKVFENSSEISISDGNKSIPVSIVAGTVKRLKVFISQNEILSLRCMAYGD